jgi:hypothetical protein
MILQMMVLNPRIFLPTAFHDVKIDVPSKTAEVIFLPRGTVINQDGLLV